MTEDVTVLQSGLVGRVVPSCYLVLQHKFCRNVLWEFLHKCCIVESET